MRSYFLKHFHIAEILPYVGFAIFVLGTKLVIIATYGNATPFWDQWDAEADFLYRPWLEGSLQWKDLFAAHNEHRILTARLLALALLELNGRVWNPILQMQVNAVLHVLSLSILLFYLSKLLAPINKSVLFYFSAVLFAIPFGWENTLAGFQSEFYFLLLFSFVFLWAMSAYETYSLKWWLGLVAGGLCLVSLASGALTILAGTLILVIRRWIANDKENVAMSAIALLLMLAVLAIVFTPNVPGHAVLKAQSGYQFLTAFGASLSWPVNKIWGVIIQIPVMVLLCLILIKKRYQSSPYFFVAAMTLWLFGQFISISYGRAVLVTISRYLDLFAMGLVINFAVLLVLISQACLKNRFLYGLGLVVWLATVMFGFSTSERKLIDDLQIKANQGLEQEKSTRAFLCTGEVGYLQIKSILYPDPQRLKGLLNNPTILSILPGNIYLPNAKYPVGIDGAPFCNQELLAKAFKVLNWKVTDDIMASAKIDSIRSNNWQGTDYYKSEIPGLQVVGSWINSDKETGTISLHLHRGEKILYRSGPSVARQFVLINNGDVRSFNTALPLALEWLILDFSKAQLPEEFDVTLIDAGTSWGEWSAIALQK